LKVIDPKSAPKDDSGQVRFKLAQWFQRRRFLKKFTDRRQTPSVEFTENYDLSILKAAADKKNQQSISENYWAAEKFIGCGLPF
jgi:hypothetical protein